MLQKLGVTAVVRLNKDHYDKNVFTQNDISHYDLYFGDGTEPPTVQVVGKRVAGPGVERRMKGLGEVATRGVGIMGVVARGGRVSDGDVIEIRPYWKILLRQPQRPPSRDLSLLQYEESKVRHYPQLLLY